MKKLIFARTSSLKYLLITVCLTGLLLLTHSAQAHAGGEPQLINGEAGPFRVSVWSLPNPLVSGEVNFITAVAEEKEINGYQEAIVVLDATVEVFLTSSDGEVIQTTATQGDAANKLFYEAYFELPQSGEWDVVINVTRGDQNGSAEFVASAARPPLNINWTLLGGITVLITAIGWFIWQSRQTEEVSS